MQSSETHPASTAMLMVDAVRSRLPVTLSMSFHQHTAGATPYLGKTVQTIQDTVDT